MKRLSKVAAALGFVLMLGLSAPFAYGSAGWYQTFKGDVIHTEVCLPKNIKSPVYLQLMGDNDFGKTVAVINFKKLPADGYCKDQLLHGLNPQGAYFDLKYDWKVNISGAYGLQFYAPNLKKPFYWWPDGVTTIAK